MPNVPMTNVNAYYSNTSPGNTILSNVIDAAIQDIVQAINDNWAIYESFVTNVTLPIPDQSIVERHIRNLAITNPKLAPSAVTNDKIADSTITAAKLADLLITTAKLADLSVTNGKLAASAVTGDKIANSTITTEKLQDLLITTGKIADQSVTEPKLGTGSVSTRALAPQSVTASKIDPSLINPISDAGIQYRFGLIDEQLADISINVKEKGAVADGVTDDSVAFQSVSNMNGPMYIPQGEYYINSIIQFNSKIVFGYGNPGTTIKLGPNGGLLFKGDFCHATGFRVTAADRNNRPAYGIKLNSENHYGLYEDIHFSYCQKGILTSDNCYVQKMRDITVLYADIGIHVAGNENNNIVIDHCTLLANRVNIYCGMPTGTIYQALVTIINCDIEQSTETGIYIRASGHFVVNHNYIERNNTLLSTDVDKCGVFVGSVSSGPQPYNFVFTHNFLLGNGICLTLSPLLERLYKLDSNTFRYVSTPSYALRFHNSSNYQFHKITTINHVYDLVDLITNEPRAIDPIVDGGLVRKSYYTSISKYVDPSNGNDANPGTSALPYQTIPRAVIDLPDILNTDAKIILKSGTYGAQTFKGIRGSGTFSLEADAGATPTFTGPITFSLCEIATTIKGLTINVSNSNPIIVTSSSYVTVDGCTCAASSAVAFDGVYFEKGSEGRVINTSVSNYRHAIKSVNNSNIYTSGLSGSGNTAAYGVLGGIIAKGDNSSPAASGPDFKSYGLIIPNSGMVQSATQANSIATDVAGVVADLNSLLTKLKNAGLMA